MPLKQIRKALKESSDRIINNRNPRPIILEVSRIENLKLSFVIRFAKKLDELKIFINMDEA